MLSLAELPRGPAAHTLTFEAPGPLWWQPCCRWLPRLRRVAAAACAPAALVTPSSCKRLHAFAWLQHAPKSAHLATAESPAKGRWSAHTCCSHGCTLVSGRPLATTFYCRHSLCLLGPYNRGMHTTAMYAEVVTVAVHTQANGQPERAGASRTMCRPTRQQLKSAYDKHCRTHRTASLTRQPPGVQASPGGCGAGTGMHSSRGSPGNCWRQADSERYAHGRQGLGAYECDGQVRALASQRFCHPGALRFLLQQLLLCSATNACEGTIRPCVATF